jgi:hypothetical protein
VRRSITRALLQYGHYINGKLVSSPNRGWGCATWDIGCTLLAVDEADPCLLTPHGAPNYVIACVRNPSGGDGEQQRWGGSEARNPSVRRENGTVGPRRGSREQQKR